jgi:CarD family transcriptional regulator
MQFSVGDKVVHPHHGPGRVTSIEHREFLDGKKRYYVIEIPVGELTVYVPRRKADQVGVRAAMSRAKLRRMLDELASKPQRLAEDYRERQERTWEKLRTGRVMQIAQAIRDLTWHKQRAHLTKKDSELLAQGTARLAAEMALVLGTEVTDMEKIIDDTLANALISREEPDRRHQWRIQPTGEPHSWR